MKELLRSLARREIPLYEEAAAQVRKLVAAGIRPSHIDSHKHSHVLPPVLDAVARVARDFDIPWVRRPFDYGTGAGVNVLRRVVAAGMRMMSPRFATALQGLKTTDHFTGFLVPGALTDARFVEILERLPPGLTEFMCHPGRLGPELRAAATRLKESRQTELAALLSPLVREAIEQRGIELINFRQA